MAKTGPIRGKVTAPIISSNGGGATASVALDVDVAAVTTVVATQPHGGGPIVYSIVAGGDGALFSINSSTGALTFLSAPTFDGVYHVTVKATGRGSLTDTQAITVTVTGDVTDTALIDGSGNALVDGSSQSLIG